METKRFQEIKAMMDAMPDEEFMTICEDAGFRFERWAPLWWVPDWLAFFLMDMVAWLDRKTWKAEQTQMYGLFVKDHDGNDFLWFCIRHDGWTPGRYV
jgi:hypothetical protein